MIENANLILNDVLSDPSKTWSLHARWAVPIDQPPVENATLTVRGAEIVSLRKAPADRADIDLGDAVILPGLVNAHTHLDLCGLEGRPLPMDSFVDWLEAVVSYRRGLDDSQLERQIRGGVRQSIRHGVTLLGDISGQGKSWGPLSTAPIRSVAFYELLGLTRARARTTWAATREWLSNSQGGGARLGLSPHSPYSVRKSLLRASASWASRHRLPVAIHVAESFAEMELLSAHRGPMVPFLQRLGVWDPDGLVSSLDALVRLFETASAVWIHGNLLDPGLSLPQGHSVVVCPRTYAAFGHSSHPFPQLMRRDVRVALGTDGLGSAPDLNLLSEARYLHGNESGVSAAQLVRMCTLNGAEALGFAEDTGSLTPGKSADLAIFPLLQGGARAPCENILDSDCGPTAVFSQGRLVAGAIAGIER